MKKFLKSFVKWKNDPSENKFIFIDENSQSLIFSFRDTIKNFDTIPKSLDFDTHDHLSLLNYSIEDSFVDFETKFYRRDGESGIATIRLNLLNHSHVFMNLNIYKFKIYNIYIKKNKIAFVYEFRGKLKYIIEKNSIKSCAIQSVTIPFDCYSNLINS